MVDIQLFGLVVDSTLVQIAIGIIAILIAIFFGYSNLHKKSIPASEVESSQSVNNSSGIIQQTANNMNIEHQTIIIADEINESIRLNDIDNQLTELYLPMENYIREYMNSMTAMSNDPNLVNLHKIELQRRLGELETQYPGQIDRQVYDFLRRFFAGECPIAAFRHEVSIKIRALRTERNRYL